jgi:putative addiction module killer protein
MEVLRYQRSDGREPVSEWLRSLGDKRLQAKVRLRIKRLEAGIFGDCEAVGEGVLELREHLDPGYRVYFGRRGQRGALSMLVHTTVTLR